MQFDPYPTRTSSNSHVPAAGRSSSWRWRFHFGAGTRLKAYGPASGGLVLVRNTCAGPMSAFLLVSTSLAYCSVSSSAIG